MDLYKDYFGFKEPPFELTPDPDFLFLSRSHEEAMESLCYGISRRKGFMLVSGEVGSGKTTICRSLLGRLEEGIDSSLILNPSLNEKDLLAAIVHDFGITRTTNEIGDLLEALANFLLAGLTKGRNAVLIIDEAQNLPFASMEMVRMISNLETPKEKLIQIILAGQPELEEKLRHPDLRQMSQRISIRVNLGGLSAAETAAYIAHRLRVAGASPEAVRFTPGAVRSARRHSRGLPRLINSICDRALAAAYVKETKTINRRLAERAAREVMGRTRISPIPKPVRRAAAVLAASFALGIAVGVVRRFVLAPALSTPAAAVSRTGSGAEAVIGGLRYRSGGLIATDDHNLTPLAAIGMILRLQGLEHLAAEVGSWRVMNFEPKLLSLFFRGADVVSQYQLGIVSGGGLESGLKLDTPFMVRLRDPGRGPYYVVLGRADRDRITVYDPLRGMRSVDIAAVKSAMDGPPIFILPGYPVSGELKKGDRGSSVMRLQELLRASGRFYGHPGGVFDRETEQALLAVQKYYGLEKNGRATAETWLVLGRAAKAVSVPRLEGATR